jgi:hypothetical protein
MVGALLKESIKPVCQAAAGFVVGAVALSAVASGASYLADKFGAKKTSKPRPHRKTAKKATSKPKSRRKHRKTAKATAQ